MKNQFEEAQEKWIECLRENTYHIDLLADVFLRAPYIKKNLLKELDKYNSGETNEGWTNEEWIDLMLEGVEKEKKLHSEMTKQFILSIKH